MKSDKGCCQTRPLCLYCLILLAGTIAFVVFNENFFYLITIFVVLLTDAKAVDKAQSGA
jgi:hypothetical protein